MRLLARVLILAFFANVGIAAQNDAIAPGTDLLVDGIPPIPASLAKAADFARNSFADSLLGWDPVKLEPAVIRRQSLAWQIGRVAAPGEGPRMFSYVPAGCYETYYHPSGKSLIFRIDDTLGKEITQLYRYDIESRSKTLLTDGKSRNLYPIWSNSAEWLMYSSTRRNGKDLDIYTVNPTDPKTDHLLAQLSGEDWAAFDWSPDDRKVILSDYRSINESYLWILDVATGQKTLLTPSQKGQKVFNGSYAQFSKDGKGVYHITDRDSEFQRLAYVDIATGRYTYLTNDLKWDVEEITLSRDRTRLGFITNEEGISRLHVLNTETNKEVTIPKLPAGVISGLKWHSDGTHLGFVFNATTSPDSIYSIDLKTGKLEKWTESSLGGIDADALPIPEIVKWKSFDGTLIPGVLYRPPSKFTGKRPVLIDIHGGPDIQHRPNFRGKDNYFTSQLGVAMIYPNIRGSAGYGKTYLKLDNGLLRENSYKDIGALLDWIRTQPFLDADRVVIRGVSNGANVALAVAASYGARIRGAIAISGASNLATWMDSLDQWYRDRFHEEYGDERDPTMRRYLEKVAPVNNAKAMKGPLLIIHGKLDARVPVAESERMIAAAKSEGIKVWSILIKNEGHGFANPRTNDFVFLSQVRFLQQYLPGADAMNTGPS